MLINSFIHQWTRTSDAARQIMELEVQGLPANYYQNYIDNLKSVTADDVLKVAQKYLHPEQTIVILVGKKSEMIDFPPDLQIEEISLPPEYLE